MASIVIKPKRRYPTEGIYIKPTQDQTLVGNSLKMSDVFGVFDEGQWLRISWGMTVARGLPKSEPKQQNEAARVCPIWHDALPYKSLTVICGRDQVDDVIEWLVYVHGADCVSAMQFNVEWNGKKVQVAIRSNYMCW